jgi:O-antigen/teichoic acid export membrane protein
MSQAESEVPESSRPLWRPAATYAFTNAIAAAIPFLLLPVLTRVLTPEEYGRVAMFSVMVTVFGAFTGLNVHGSIAVRYFGKEPIDFPRYVSACLSICAVSSIMVFLMVFALGGVLETVTGLPLFWLLVAVCVATALAVIQLQLAIWQVENRPWSYGFLRMTQAALDAAFSLCLVLVFLFAWQGRVSGIAIGAILAALAAALIMFASGRVRFPTQRDYVKSAIRFGGPLIPHVLGAILISIVDRVVITNVIDVGSTGIYMVAVQIGTALGLAADSFNRAYAPWLMAALRIPERQRDLKIVRFTYGYFVVIALIAALIGMLAPQLLAVLVGEQFRAAAPVVLFVALGYAFSGMYFMVTNYVFYAGRTASLAVITLSCGLGNVALSYYLVTENGVIGAAQAFACAQGLLFACTWILAQRSHPMPWRAGLAGVRAA